MDNYIYIGKIINTFGIKGEIKILSNFEFKDRVFLKDKNLYIGEYKIKEKIINYRIHKNYDLITFDNYNNINEVLKYKGLNVYINRNELDLKDGEYLLSDLIGFKVYDNSFDLGVVIDYINDNNLLLKIKGEKTFYIPLNDYYIKNIDLINKTIMTNGGKDLII